jgi:hypothetical protein
MLGTNISENSTLKKTLFGKKIIHIFLVDLEKNVITTPLKNLSTNQ